MAIGAARTPREGRPRDRYGQGAYRWRRATGARGGSSPAGRADAGRCTAPRLRRLCALSRRSSMATLAVLGTGLLGSGMVENLLAKGHRVRIWNRSPDKLAPLLAKGAIAAADPAAAARGAERVHLVLAEDAAVDAVVAALRP